MHATHPRPQFAVLVTLLLAASFLGTGCGGLTITTWVKVDEAQSSGSVAVLDDEFPLDAVQGGFLAVVRLDTRNLLAPLPGTIRLADVRIAASEPEFLGEVCTWGNPSLPSSGTVVVDILGGPSSANLTLNLLATTRLSEDLALDPVALTQPATFALGNGLSIQTLLAAQTNGTADGLFETDAAFVGDATVGPFPVQFRLDIHVTNDGVPPAFDPDLLAFCAPYFEQQGRSLFWSVNSHSTFLMTDALDDSKPPLVLRLADIGAGPGDVLRLRRVGVFAPTVTLKDGSLTSMIGVFSSNGTVLPMHDRVRVPGAIDAGTDVTTGVVIHCEIIVVCLPTSTNIPQDFMIDPSIDIAVPAGATHLIAAPLSPGLLYRDNSSFSFGLSVEVLP
jgi:hypothetical protein